MGERIKLKGNELIEILNEKFIGKSMCLCVNGVTWSGELEIKKVDSFGIYYSANNVSFYIYKFEEYSYEYEDYLGMREVK